MRFAVAVLVILALPASASAATRDCGQVGFTPQSDDVAGQITATGVTCRDARRLVRRTEGRPGSRFGRWRCSSRKVDDPMGLAHSVYRCRLSTRRFVRWNRY
jgi:hypothetical protein